MQNGYGGMGMSMGMNPNPKKGFDITSFIPALIVIVMFIVLTSIFVIPASIASSEEPVVYDEQGITLIRKWSTESKVKCINNSGDKAIIDIADTRYVVDNNTETELDILAPYGTFKIVVNGTDEIVCRFDSHINN